MESWKGSLDLSQNIYLIASHMISDLAVRNASDCHDPNFFRIFYLLMIFTHLALASIEDN